MGSYQFGDDDHDDYHDDDDDDDAHHITTLVFLTTNTHRCLRSPIDNNSHYTLTSEGLWPFYSRAKSLSQSKGRWG